MKYDSKNKSDVVSISSASSDYVRYAKLLAASHGRPSEMRSLGRGVPGYRLQQALQQKSAVDVGTTTDSDWGSPLVEMANAFLSSLKPFSVFDKMLGDMQRRPFNTRFSIASSTATGGPVAEMACKPISQLSFTGDVLEPSKVHASLVFTDEVARLMNAESNAAIAYELRKAVGIASDQFLTDVILTTAGVQSISSTGNDPSAFRADLSSALALLNIEASSKLWIIMPVALWASLSVQRDASRVLELAAVFGNTIQVAPTSVLTDSWIVVDAASCIGVSQGIELASSDAATIQLSDAPSSGEQTGVNLWQSDMVAVRAERRLAAALLRSDGAVLIENVTA